MKHPGLALSRRVLPLLIAAVVAFVGARRAEASIGTPGQQCTAADYQAANECLSSWVGLGGLFGGCDLVCNELATNAPPPGFGGELRAAGGQAIVDTVKAIPGAVVGIVTQIGNDIYECATDPFGGWQCVRVGVLVGGVACSVFVPGCAPVVMGAAIAGSTGYCAYVCLGTNDETACQNACATSIVVNATVAYGGYRMSVAARAAAVEDAAAAGGAAGEAGGGAAVGPRPMPVEQVPQVGTPRPPPGVRTSEVVNGQVQQNPTAVNLSAGEPVPTPPPGAPTAVNVGMTAEGNAVAAAEVNGMGHPTLAPVNGQPTILAAAGELRPLPGGGYNYAPRSRYNNLEPPTPGQVQAFISYLRSIGIDVRGVEPW
ncbi:MAG: hypothetical protein KBG48_27725 [Kofleriaceae bacterium]|jgi:hypothetical protein|nr:hypothetical protein [Kofleriaceae bacterium]MBP9171221.1 hypothetical protein [Kofleriaceae bacterium]MBP9861790.1 hypothetical protein [Kofleriaceae bacterium]